MVVFDPSQSSNSLVFFLPFTPAPAAAGPPPAEGLERTCGVRPPFPPLGVGMDDWRAMTSRRVFMSLVALSSNNSRCTSGQTNDHH